MRKILIAIALLLIGSSSLAINNVKIELDNFIAGAGRIMEKEEARMADVIALLPKPYDREDFSVFKEDRTWIEKENSVAKIGDTYALIVGGETIADTRVNSTYLVNKGNLVEAVPNNVKHFVIIVFCEGKLLLVAPNDKDYTVLDPKART